MIDQTIIRVTNSRPKAEKIHEILMDMNVVHKCYTAPSKRYPGTILYKFCSDGFELKPVEKGIINRIIDTQIGSQEKHLL